MTQQKDLKRVVRTRMQKTGESYTAARAHVLARRDADAAPVEAAADLPAAAPDYAALAGMSDETIAAKTGCTWKQWVGHLDDVGASTRPHREIAAHVHEAFGISGWWAQTVTVGYERIRGLRQIGQRREGSFEAGKNKTFPVPVSRLFAAFADPAQRAQWLPGVELQVRKATPDTSMRITWGDGSSVDLWFTAKGAEKCSVAVQHGKLPDRPRAEELKRFWGERLEALAGFVAGGAGEP
jgi:hypothetical protein